MSHIYEIQIGVEKAEGHATSAVFIEQLKLALAALNTEWARVKSALPVAQQSDAEIAVRKILLA